MTSENSLKDNDEFCVVVVPIIVQIKVREAFMVENPRAILHRGDACHDSPTEF